MLLDTGVSAKRIAELATYLIDGAYLNKILSKSMSAHVSWHRPSAACCGLL